MFYKQFPILKWAAAALFSVASIAGVSAKNVNADDARSLAEQFLGLNISRASEPMRLVFSASRSGVDEAAYYVFDAGAKSGFVVVAGDDAVSPILGYSLTSSFNPDDIPPALQWQLDQYRNELSSLTAEQVHPVSRSISRSPVEPLLTTRWGQRQPFNRLTPFFDGQLSPTGCIATALAQILYHHRGVERPTGSHSYEWRGETFSYDYSKASFDWDSMKDIYWGVEVTDAEADAVAELMLACGIGVNMGYEGDGSGSDIVFAKRFLVDNMGYNPEMALQYKNNYTPDEWNNLLHNELVNNRPVICQGGGHAYLCDGYDGEGYFHFNWGWNGAYDGYFLLSLLNPTETDNFQKNMYVLTGVEGSLTEEIYWMPDLTCRGDFKINEDGKAVIQVWNLSAKEFQGKLGAKIISPTGETVKWYEFVDSVDLPEVELLGIWTSTPGDTYRLKLPDDLGLEAGTYTLTPGYHAGDSVWRDLRCFTGCQDHILLEVTESGQYVYSNPQLPETPTYNVTITDMFIEHFGWTGVTPNVVGTYTNTEDLPCRPNLVFIFSKDGSIYAEENFAIALEGSQVLRYGTQFGKEFEEGDYQLDIYDEYGRKVNDETLNFSVIPKPDPSGITVPEADGWDDAAPVEYFDMQGRRVANPVKGVYIARQGALTKKIFIH